MAKRHPRARMLIGFLLVVATLPVEYGLGCCAPMDLSPFDATAMGMRFIPPPGVRTEIASLARRSSLRGQGQNAAVEGSVTAGEASSLSPDEQIVCLWEHRDLDGTLITTPLPMECHGPIRSDSRPVVTTAYYSPVAGQRRYVTGSLEGDREVNGQGFRTADGTEPQPGVIAAPRSYEFGTKLYLEGAGLCTVRDRGGWIRHRRGQDRLDIWTGSGDIGRQNAENWGVQELVAMVFLEGDESDIRQIIDTVITL